MFLVEYPAEAEVKEILAELERASVPARTGVDAGTERRGYGGAWCVWVTVPAVLPLPADDSKRTVIRIVVSAIAHQVIENRPPSVEQGDIALIIQVPGVRIAFLYGPDDLDDQYAWDAMFMLIGDCEVASTYAWDGRWYAL